MIYIVFSLISLSCKGPLYCFWLGVWWPSLDLVDWWTRGPVDRWTLWTGKPHGPVDPWTRGPMDSLFTIIHHYSQLFTNIRHNSPLFIMIHHYSPLFSIIHHDLLMFPNTSHIHEYSQLFTIIHHISSLFTQTRKTKKQLLRVFLHGVITLLGCARAFTGHSFPFVF